MVYALANSWYPGSLGPGSLPSLIRPARQNRRLVITGKGERGIGSTPNVHEAVLGCSQVVLVPLANVPAEGARREGHIWPGDGGGVEDRARYDEEP
jgi:hypothetical protein